MEAMRVQNPSVWSVSERPWETVRAALGWTSGALLVAVAAILLARRWAQALSEPLNAVPLLSVIGACAILAGLTRWLVSGAERRRRSARCDGVVARSILSWCPTIALVGIVGSLALPGTSLIVLALAILVTAMEEVSSRWALTRGRFGRQAGSANAAFWERPPRQPDRPAPEASASLSVLNRERAEHVRQQMVRMQLADGSDRVEGWCRTSFAAGCRHGVEHLAFCPPFAVTPQLWCKAVAGPPVQLRVMRVLPYGARIELRLESIPSQPTQVFVQFTATAMTADVRVASP